MKKVRAKAVFSEIDHAPEFRQARSYVRGLPQEAAIHRRIYSEDRLRWPSGKRRTKVEVLEWEAAFLRWQLWRAAEFEQIRQQHAHDTVNNYTRQVEALRKLLDERVDVTVPIPGSTEVCPDCAKPLSDPPCDKAHGVALMAARADAAKLLPRWANEVIAELYTKLMYRTGQLVPNVSPPPNGPPK